MILNMHQTAQLNSQKEIHFAFKTKYLGQDVNLTVFSSEDQYTVMLDNEVIGHIKLGDIRHTWYVVDSKYIEPYLINEIGQRIEAYYFLKQA